ncbi:SDR family oxidoreductase [Microcoleus sp. FACHB-1515]|uniref:SDR family NAD(P)-dependent oxidoreductase n=1 Tax=Cyanophyceae TaxID=3028117 RepID=UPI00168551DE|nr:SDR family oxidoreductase [Microcoleus sp. FACHB-1515]MBD2089680.1 SDR family oxidoreductase [Microcoleus sp. FACHB-1515]
MKTALITGASMGIGATFAQTLAARSTNLILVARSQDKLDQLAEQLRTQHQVQVETIVQDLTAPNAATIVFNRVRELGLTVDLLVNNAGFGEYGAFADIDRQRQLDMVQLNVSATVDLTHQYLQEMRSRRSGSIINLASTAAFQGMPYLAVYAATKAFVLSFTEALIEENREFGVRILALCPGPTETNFFDEADFPPNLANVAARAATDKKTVVTQALDALEKGQAIVVPGQIYNQLFASSYRLLPREWLSSMIGKLLRPQPKSPD